MRHAFVFIEVFGCEGGIQSYIQDVLEAYGDLSHQDTFTAAMRADVFLLRDAAADGKAALSKNQSLQAGCIRYHYFRREPTVKSPMVERIRLALALSAYLIRHRPNRVFCGHVNLAVLVSQLCRLLNIPYTVLTYGKEVWYELPPRQKKAIAAADKLWTISRYSRDLACEANHISPAKFEMLPCVVDGDIFTPGQPPQALVDRYCLQGARILMTVARLWPGDIYKGVDVTIRALPQIAEAFPTVKYMVIGRGDDQPRLAQLAADLKVAERVVFAGYVPDQALMDHYRLADVYVMPSKEGFGIVYLEAMACGVPVVAGNEDGSADPLQDGRLGWQVPYRDPEAVAIACIEALTGEDQRCNGVWLRQESLASFSASALSERLKTLLRH